MRRVASARVVFADHDLLHADFPELRDGASGDLVLDGDGDGARERWLLEHAGVVSEAQMRGEAANARIDVHTEARAAWRPTRYGRAVVVPAHDPATGAPCGLLDVKGAGVAPGRTPSLELHSSGLCSLREVLREVLFQALIDEIFRRAAPALWTVPVYGVIDLGFDAKTRAGETLAAGALVRRAHRRPLHGRELPLRGTVEELTKLETEMLLRHYGITSSNRGTRFRFARADDGLGVWYAGNPVTDLSAEQVRWLEAWLAGKLPLECDAVNVQLVREIGASNEVRAQLVDFGQYEMRQRFDDPIVSLAHGEVLQWGAAIWPGDPGFVQPRPALCISEDRWGFPAQAAGDGPRPRRAEGEGPSVLARELARGFRHGSLSGRDVRSAIDAHVSESIAHW
ncbi:MAG: hypothetical protein QOD51_1507 [Candidatus Eremiobacteraeota bacterium]|nr:hypothetical protein [Candidatus Eremiobacteraeota bacterium]